MLHVWQVIRSRLASAGLPLTLWLAIVLYAVSHLLPVTRLFDQWLLGWEASISTVEIAAETLWRGKHEWLFVFGWLPNLWFWLGVACWVISRRRNRRLAGRTTVASPSRPAVGEFGLGVDLAAHGQRLLKVGQGLRIAPLRLEQGA
jgi:hypothetical protein